MSPRRSRMRVRRRRVADKSSVLVADDQQEMLDVLAERLTELGKRVVAFTSGAELARHVADTPPEAVELVVLDLDFGPGQPDGLEILRRVKADRPELPVIILTGKGSVDAAVEAVQSGAAPRMSQSRAAQAERPPSVVVLPFANLSRGEQDEFFGDGLTEELINALSQAGGIEVVSRTTAFQFKGKASDVREIGRKLKVSTALEGSVRTDGNRVRITVQLVNVADGYQLWSGRYDRELDDIFAVQDEIAQTIVDTLQRHLKGRERKTLVRKPTDDREAYELYLKGRHHCNNWTGSGLERGIELFQQALARDESFAQAQIGLAEAYIMRGFWGLVSPRDAWSRVRTAAARALAIDDRLGEARAALASVLAVDDWNWAGSKAEFDQALELSPKAPWSRYWYATMYLVPQGRIEDAAGQTRRALELDPLSPAFHAAMAWFHSYAGEYGQSIRQAREGIELAPTFLENFWILASAHLHRGEAADALVVLEKA